jgi:hypothetical protein
MQRGLPREAYASGAAPPQSAAAAAADDAAVPAEEGVPPPSATDSGGAELRRQLSLAELSARAGLAGEQLQDTLDALDGDEAAAQALLRTQVASLERERLATRLAELRRLRAKRAEQRGHTDQSSAPRPLRSQTQAAVVAQSQPDPESALDAEESIRYARLLSCPVSGPDIDGEVARAAATYYSLLPGFTAETVQPEFTAEIVQRILRARDDVDVEQHSSIVERSQTAIAAIRDAMCPSVAPPASELEPELSPQADGQSEQAYSTDGTPPFTRLFARVSGCELDEETVTRLVSCDLDGFDAEVQRATIKFYPMFTHRTVQCILTLRGDIGADVAMHGDIIQRSAQTVSALHDVMRTSRSGEQATPQSEPEPEPEPAPEPQSQSEPQSEPEPQSEEQGHALPLHMAQQMAVNHDVSRSGGLTEPLEWRPHANAVVAEFASRGPPPESIEVVGVSRHQTLPSSGAETARGVAGVAGLVGGGMVGGPIGAVVGAVSAVLAASEATPNTYVAFMVAVVVQGMRLERTVRWSEAEELATAMKKVSIHSQGDMRRPLALQFLKVAEQLPTKFIPIGTSSYTRDFLRPLSVSIF